MRGEVDGVLEAKGLLLWGKPLLREAIRRAPIHIDWHIGSHTGVVKKDKRSILMTEVGDTVSIEILPC